MRCWNYTHFSKHRDHSTPKSKTSARECSGLPGWKAAGSTGISFTL